jgi:16S rRNA (guanine527-N7)-methyltransferase
LSACSPELLGDPDQLRLGLLALGVPADESLVLKLRQYLGLLTRASQSFNLTSIRDPHDMVVLHVLDALTARPFLAGARILDAGTGAGLPGVPLALVEPQRRFTLVDATLKKVRFVREVIEALSIPNASVEQARIESFGPPGAFDTVISRALSSLTRFAADAAHLVAPGGRLVAMKGRWPETTPLRVPRGFCAPDVTRVSLPGRPDERHLVVLTRQ